MSKFGYLHLITAYGLKGFILDSIVPVLLALSAVIVAIVFEADPLSMLKRIVDIGLQIVPSMVALVLAAYTIVLSFILSDRVKNIIKGNKTNQDFIENLNSNFAVFLIASSAALLFLIGTSYVSTLNVAYNYANVINLFVLFIVIYFLLFSLWLIFAIIIDLYNIGQTVFFDQ